MSIRKGRRTTAQLGAKMQQAPARLPDWRTASGLAVDCWDWPVAYPQTAMSALFLLQQRNWRSNLDAIVSRSRGWPRSGLSHLTKS